jgi:hypothetical protein
MSTLFSRAVVGGQAVVLDFKGEWNASTNSPTLVSSVGTVGEAYRVSTAGATSLDSISSWLVDDYVYFDGSAWQKDNHNNPTVTPLAQTNVVYVSKAGNDSNSGLTPELPKLTIASAYGAATSPSTTNRWVVEVLDAGIYAGGLTFPDYVSLYAPAATLDLTGAAVSMGDESSVHIHRAVGTATLFSCAGSTTQNWFTADYLETPVTAFSVNTATIATIDIKEILITGAGVAVGCVTGSLRGRVGRIRMTGAGTALACLAGTSEFNVHVDEITDTGSATAINVANTLTANITAGKISTNTAYNTNTNGILNLMASSLSGSTAGSGTVRLLVPGTVQPISLGGTGQTTAGAALAGLGTLQSGSGFGIQNVNWSAGITQLWQATGNVTFTFTNPNAGTVVHLVFQQDGVGTRTATWPAGVTWAGTATGTPNTGASAYTIFKLVHLGSGSYVGTQA